MPHIHDASWHVALVNVLSVIPSMLVSIGRYAMGTMTREECKRNLLAGAGNLAFTGVGAFAGGFIGSFFGPAGAALGGAIGAGLASVGYKQSGSEDNLAKLKRAYEYFGVDESTPMNIIEAKFRYLSRAHHPDKPWGNEEKYKELESHMQVIRRYGKNK